MLQYLTLVCTFALCKYMKFNPLILEVTLHHVTIMSYKDMSMFTL